MLLEDKHLLLTLYLLNYNELKFHQDQKSTFFILNK